MEGSEGMDNVSSARTMSSTKRRRDAREKELIKALKKPEAEAQVTNEEDMIVPKTCSGKLFRWPATCH